jgi:hypothetical protein
MKWVAWLLVRGNKGITKFIQRRVSRLYVERMAILKRRNGWPASTLGFDRLNLAFEFWGFKIEVLKAFLRR